MKVLTALQQRVKRARGLLKQLPDAGVLLHSSRQEFKCGSYLFCGELLIDGIPVGLFYTYSTVTPWVGILTSDGTSGIFSEDGTHPVQSAFLQLTGMSLPELSKFLKVTQKTILTWTNSPAIHLPAVVVEKIVQTYLFEN